MRWGLAAGIFVIAISGASLPGAAEVTVQQWIEPGRDIVARRQVDLYIEVATDGFFAGGTRIGEFEIPGVVVLRRELFAVNSTRITDGVTWAVQRWKIALYPQQPGRFEIPSISIRVMTGPAAQRMETATRSIGFDARLPDGMNSSGSWVAVPTLEVTESYDRADAEFEALKAGDALVRIIEMRASDTVAMMLPELRFTAPAGVSVYREPPRLEDSVNRGVTRASRRETITYVIEKAGRYALPELELLWWDTEAAELRRHVLPARTLVTGGFVDPAPSMVPGLVRDSDEGSRSFIYPLVAVASLLLVLFGLRWLTRRARVAQRRHLAASLDQQLDRAVESGDVRQLLVLLYRWLDTGGEGAVADAQSHLKGKAAGRAHTLRSFIATLDQAEIETARVDAMQAGFRESAASRADPKVLRTLRRMTRRLPAAAAKGSMPFALN